MPELATAWITLAVSADGMQRQIRRALNDVDADGAGRRTGQQFSSAAVRSTNLTGIEQRMADAGRRGAQALGTALKVGVAGAATAATGIIASSLKLGFDRLTAIDEAKAKLTGLGNDTRTTAKIMDSALAAVKGTAFGLGDAATIAANAVAAGVKPGQELTNYLKMTADASAIAGSSLGDMGRIINQVRTGQKAYTDDLNQLADRGIPIYQWLAEEAGVAAGDVKKLASEGKISSEQFEAAISKHIGGAAQKMGSSFKGSLDNMKAALGRGGAAALEPFFNRLTGGFGSATTALDALTPKVKEMSQQFDAKIFDEWIPAAKSAWEAVQGNSAVRSNLSEVKSLLMSLASNGREVWPALVQIGQALGQASAALGVSSWRIFLSALEAAAGVLKTITPLVQGLGNFMSSHQGLVTAAAGAWLLFRTIPAVLGRVTGATVPLTQSLSRMGQQITGQAGALVPLRSRLTAIAGDYRNIGTAAQNNGQHLSSFNRLMTAASNNSPTIRNMSNAFIGASSNVRGFTAALRVGAQPALNGLKSAASGVVGALGGPFSAALVAGVAAFTLWSAQVQKGEQRARDYAESLRLSARAQREVYEELAKSRGATNESVFTGLSKQVDEFRNQVNSLRTGPDLLDWLGARGTRGTEAFGMQERAEQWQVVSDAMDKLNMSSQQLGIALAGDASWEALQQNIRETTGNSGDLIGKFAEIRKEFLDSQAASQALAPAFTTVKDAIATIADAASSAEDKTSAFKTALDALAGIQPSVQEATDRYNTTIRQTAQAAAEVADASKGMGQQLIGADGSVNTATENGHALFEALKNIRSATEGVAGAGGDLKSALAQNDQQLGALATKFGLTKQQVDAMAAAMGYVPSTIETLFEMRGADDATKQLGLVQELLKQVPPNTPIQIDADSANKARDDLVKLGAKLEEVDVNGHKQLKITAPNAQVLSDIQAVIDKVKQVPSTFRIDANLRTPDFVPAVPGETKRPRGGGRADGAIVPSGAIMPMADGGLKWISKPRTADIYSGRGAGTIFAEEETGGEAYIPLAPSKRGRSMAILMEVARLFGIGRNAEGSITVDELKSFASGISGGEYVRGGPAGLTGTDCSGGQAAIANFITGASGRFATGNEAQALSARGFQQGDPPSGIAAYWIGWKNGGPGGGHTAGTILDPEGGNVNVEMGGKSGGGQYGGGAAGASEFPNRAWIALAGYGEDPTKSGGSSAAVKSASASVTSAKASTASAQTALDKANADLDALRAKGASADKLTAAEKKRDVAEQKLTAAQERQTAAETRLSEVKDKEATKAEKDTGAQGFGQQLASGLFGGVMESIGLPGFSNLLEWPLLKSGQSLLNAFAGPIKGALEGKLGIQQPGWSPGMPIGDEGNVVGLPGGGGELPGISLPGVGDFLKPMPDAGRQLRPNEAHQGTGGAPGPTTTVNYNMSGVDPKAGLLKADAHANQTYKKTMGGVRPQ